MDIATFRAMQQQFRDEGLFEVSYVKGWATILTELAVFTFLALGLIHVKSWDWFYWGLEFLAGISIFRMFVILHECGHKTLFRSKTVNSLVGLLVSIFCLVPYFSWRNVHRLHHRWVGVVDKDPTERHLLQLRNAPAPQHALFRIVWRLWIPVPFIKFIIQVYWGYALERWRSGDSRNARLGLISNAVCILGHLGIIAIIGPERWAMFYLPMLAVFYLIFENMALPQHSELFPHLSDSHPNPVRLAEQDAITRSTHLPDWLGALLSLNLNRHVEHHMFPAAPWYVLNRIRRRLLETGYRHLHEVPFFIFMWRFRRRDPVEIYVDSIPVETHRSEST